MLLYYINKVSLVPNEAGASDSLLDTVIGDTGICLIVPQGHFRSVAMYQILLTAVHLTIIIILLFISRAL